MSLHELLSERFTDTPASLMTFIEQSSDQQKSLLQAIMESHSRAEAIGVLEPLKVAAAHINGAKHALDEILKELGDRDYYFDIRHELQSVARQYLTACKFKGANKLSISNNGRVKLVMAEPESSPLAYHQITLSFLALKAELELAHMSPLSDEETLGGLIFSLMLRDGALTIAEVKRALVEIQAKRLARIDQIWYIQGPIGKDGQQFRRLLLSPITLAFLFRWSAKCSNEAISHSDINKSLKAFSQRLGHHQKIRWASFKGLQSFATRFLRLQQDMPQHVMDYMTGALESTSLAESCWTQLFGFQPSQEMLKHEQESKELRLRSAAKPKVMRPNFVKEICVSLAQKPQALARTSTLAMLESVISGLTPQPKLIRQLSEFVDWMLSINGLQSSTAKMHLENLSQVLFPMVSSLNQRVDSPDVWEALFENMLRDETKYSKSLNAVSKFAEFLSRTHDVGFSSAGFSAAALVNANILTKQQKDDVVSLVLLKHGHAEPKVAEVACHLIELAYGLGARRWELLGLHFNDVLGPREPLIRFVRNASRDLKSDASTRQLSLKHLISEPFFSAWQRFAKNETGTEKDTNIIEAQGVDLKRLERKIFKAISGAIKEITGLDDASFHTFRHTAACRFLLSLYWRDLELLGLDKYDYFRQIEDESELIRDALLRKNTENFLEHKTVSAFLGHLSYKTTAAHYFHFYCLLRFGYMNLANMCSPLKDMPEYLSSITGVKTNSDQSISTALLTISEKLSVSSIHVNTASETHREVILSTDGAALKRVLITVTDSTIMKLDEEKSLVLANILLDTTRRDDFIVQLNQKSKSLISLYEKKGLLKKTKGMMKRHEEMCVAFQMPSAPSFQSAIGALLLEIERLYPIAAQRRELAKNLISALSYFSPRDIETFCFHPSDNPQDILAPILSILGECSVQICYWHRTKERIPPKGPRDVNSEKLIIQGLSQLPEIRKGRLMVRLEATNSNANFKPAVLTWVIGAMHLAYGLGTVE